MPPAQFNSYCQNKLYDIVKIEKKKVFQLEWR